MERRKTLVLAMLAVALAGGCNHAADEGTSAAAPAAAAPAPQAVTLQPRSATIESYTVTPSPEDNLYPVVVIRTTVGNVTIKLNAAKAPRTVENFLSYANSGHYDETIFHQVESGYAVLGGGYAPDLTERPGRYPIPNEATNGLQNRRGTIAMARRPEATDSATCQFFINLNDNPQLDHQGDEPPKFGYCVFGDVIEGMEVLEKIAGVKTHDTEQFTKIPVETVMIQAVRRIR